MFCTGQYMTEVIGVNARSNKPPSAYQGPGWLNELGRWI